MIRISETAKTAARAALRSMPAPLWERFFPKDVLALGYHMVSDEDLPHLRLYWHKNSRQFENDVAFAQGRTVEYADLVSHRLRGTALPPNGFLFTFDDGFAECFHVVRPILRKYGMGGVFFVPTDFIDDRSIFFETKASLCITKIVSMNADCIRDVLEAVAGQRPNIPARQNDRARRLLAQARISVPLRTEHRRLLLWLLSLDRDEEPRLDRLCAILSVDAVEYVSRRKIFMSSDQLKVLASEGFTVGGHGLSHHSLQAMSREQIEHEIVSSCQTVRDITNQENVPFAFPYSGRDVDRGLLADIRARYPFIEMFFDSGPLSRGSAMVVERVWAEDPPSSSNESNLPQMLRHACSTPSAWFRSKAELLPSVRASPTR